MRKEITHEQLLIQTLDEVKDLLQDLLIVEGVKAGVQKQALREMLGVDMNRITRVSKVYAKAKKQRGHSTQGKPGAE